MQQRVRDLSGAAAMAGVTAGSAHLYVQLFILLLLLEPQIIQGAASPHAPLGLHVITDARGLPLSLPCIRPLLGLHYIAALVPIAAVATIAALITIAATPAA